MENQNVRLAVSFVVGVIVGVAGYWLIADRPKTDVIDNSTMMSDEETASTTAMMMQGDNGVAVDAQAAGDKVVIKEIVLKNPGWVAIHDSINGVPGKILGAQLFDAGKNSGTVMLLRKTVPGTSYIVMLHNDDGNFKNFNSKTDLPLVGTDGKMVMTSFMTDAADPASK